MKFSILILAMAAASLCAGCKTDYGNGSPYEPGPVAGKVTGNAIGTAAGNVEGFGVGVVQGTSAGIHQTMNPSYHMVRVWSTETTPDGRTIQVPQDILVDQYGRPAKMPAPTGNPAPPAAAPAPTETTNPPPQ